MLFLFCVCYEGSDLKTSTDEMVGMCCFGSCRAHRGLPIRFRFLRYSVLFNDQSFSLLYLLFYILIYMFKEMMH